MENINITPILNALIALVLSVVSAFLIPWIKQKLGEGNMTEFLRWVEIGVSAAEQLYYSTDGEKKKAYVLNFLAEKGFDVDEQDLDAAIEAAVKKLHNELYGSSKAVTADGTGN